MSSLPQHEKNLKELKKLGFDTSEYDQDTMESWDYDVLVEIISELIDFIKPLAQKKQ